MAATTSAPLVPQNGNQTSPTEPEFDEAALNASMARLQDLHIAVRRHPPLSSLTRLTDNHSLATHSPTIDSHPHRHHCPLTHTHSALHILLSSRRLSFNTDTRFLRSFAGSAEPDCFRIGEEEQRERC